MLIKFKGSSTLFTRIFVAMTSGSSHMDSTKNTLQSNKSAEYQHPFESNRNSPSYQHFSHLVGIVLCKIMDEVPPLSGGVGSIENLNKTTRTTSHTHTI